MKELIHSWTKDDFKIEFFSGTGAGGQHRNRHKNCVRITHKETGFTETGQSFREKQKNVKDAFFRLAIRLKDHYYSEDQKPRAPVTEIVRTYNIPDNRVKDHASGFEMLWSDLDIDQMIIERKRVYNGE